jgi:hypothetical protein
LAVWERLSDLHGEREVHRTETRLVGERGLAVMLKKKVARAVNARFAEPR